MIATLTLNPTLDKIITVENFTPGELQKIKEVRVIAGGKGINVSRVIKLLEGDTLALGLVGGLTGKKVQELCQEEGLRTHFIKIEGETRSNLTILDPVKKTETHLLEPGPFINPEEENRIIAEVEELLEEMEMLILSGSLPLGIGEDIYGRVIKMAKRYGVKTILDTRGIPLRKGLGAIPFMVKPNREELESLAEDSLPTLEEVISFTKTIMEKGLEGVIVSLGREGALLRYQGRVWRAVPPQITPVDTVGSGDALVGGFFWALVEGKNVEECLRMGVACGVANALLPGAGVCRKEDIFKFLPQVRVEIL